MISDRIWNPASSPYSALALGVQTCVELTPHIKAESLLGGGSIKVTEKHYSPWVRARQEQFEGNVRRTWGEDIPKTKGTPERHEKREAVS